MIYLRCSEECLGAELSFAEETAGWWKAQLGTVREDHAAQGVSMLGFKSRISSLLDELAACKVSL